MSVSVTVAGVSYTIPQTGEVGWGDQVTAWIQKVSNSTLQTSGGSFSLTADVDFGSTYGLKAAYFTSKTANSAASGVLRLANADSIAIRNAGNTADLLFKASATGDGFLSYNSVDLVGASLTQNLTNKSLSDSTTSVVNASDATKKLVWSLGGATTASTLTLSLSQTANRTLSLPDVTDTLVARTTTDTLTNKSLSDSTVSVVNATDNTKKLSWSIGAATTGTITTLSFAQTLNRTVTFPDTTDTVAMLGLAQTFTNKTISGASNTITNVSLTSGVTGILPEANGGTHQSTYTQGDILYASAANTLSKLGVGANGTYLTVSAGVPAWGSVVSTISVATKTANYTLTNTDDVILVDASSGAVTLTLPAVASATKKAYRIKKIDSSINLVTVQANASELIDGDNTQILTAKYGALEIVPDGSAWYIF